MSTLTLTEYKEINIPVPWGYIAAKDWGEEDGEPWLALHGWLDNCGSFDNLITSFPKTQRIIAIDLPGHGLSSQLPSGFSYHVLDVLQYIRRITQYLKLETFNLIGHSMGGSISFMYTVTHPEQVKRLIMLDICCPLPRSVTAMSRRTRASVDNLLSIEDKLKSNENSHYSYAEAFEKLMESFRVSYGKGSLTEEAAKILLKRGLRNVSECGEDQWVFTRDLRHHAGSMYKYSKEVIKQFASEISCPHLIVWSTLKQLAGEDEQRLTEFFDIYRSSNSLFVEVEVEGSHHVHLNSPHVVWPHIESFLAKAKL